jgi:4-hydroxy-tetrahydrodipicolinate synthase
MCEAYRAFLRGELDTAAEIQKKLTALAGAIFCEVNPVPIKYAASLLGFCEPEYRLPLCPPDDESKKKIAAALKKFKG